MSMSNSEKDEFIRKTLESDKNMASGDEFIKKIKKDIDVSKIKLQKNTLGERRFFRFLGVLVIISLASNAYIIKNRTFSAAYITNDSQYIQSVHLEDSVVQNHVIDEIENKVKE